MISFSASLVCVGALQPLVWAASAYALEELASYFGPCLHLSDLVSELASGPPAAGFGPAEWSPQCYSTLTPGQELETLHLEQTCAPAAQQRIELGFCFHFMGWETGWLVHHSALDLSLEFWSQGSV